MAKETQPKEKVTYPRPKPLYRWFTAVPEQWFALVVRGGDLHRIIHGVRGWYVDEEDEFTFKEEEGRPRNLVSPVRAFFGREFVGIPSIQGLYTYKFAWNKYWRKQSPGMEGAEYEIQAHEPEIVCFTPFEAQYPLVFGGIEVVAQQRKLQAQEEALIPVTFIITVRTRMVKPKIALMTNVDWFGGVLTPNMQSAVKRFAGRETYDNLIRGSKDEVSKSFKDFIDDEAEFKKNILNDAGVEITDATITDIKPHPAFEKALLDLAQTQRNAQAKIAEAEGRKRATELDGEAEATKIRSIANADAERIQKTTLAIANAGPLAVKMEMWRNIEKSQLRYIGSNAGILIDDEGKPAK